MSGALGFLHIKEAGKESKAALKHWVEEINVELPKKYYEKFGERLPDIPPANTPWRSRSAPPSWMCS